MAIHNKVLYHQYVKIANDLFHMPIIQLYNCFAIIKTLKIQNTQN